MDVKRIILLIPLAIVAYLLVIKWNEDTPQSQAPQSALTASQSDAQQPDDVTQAPATSSDISAADSARPANTSALISVNTDVLNVRINPNDGSIVYAALPQQKAQLHGEEPFVLMSTSNAMYYVAQSSVIVDGQRRVSLSADRTDYRLEDGQNQLVVDLHGTLNGVDVIKRLTFTRGDYAVKQDILLNNQNARAVEARVLNELVRDQSADPTSSSKGIGGIHSYLGAVFSSPDARAHKVSLSDISKGKFGSVTAAEGWAAMSQHYFLSALIPAAKDVVTYKASTDANQRAHISYETPDATLQPGQQLNISAQIYMGPKDKAQLDKVSPFLSKTIDYGWLWFLASPLFWLLTKIHGLIGNWGWSIVLLTCVVKAILLPLSAKAYRSMAKMRKLGPEMARIKEQYGNDRQQMSKKMMEFYQKEKINPLGGCLPMVIQMPVFLALYWMLSESIELRHAPFMLWIHDLSAQDPLFILPIIMGVSMFLQQMLNPAPPDPMQAKVMRMLPVIFTFFFLWFPAGLVIYWITNNLLSIAQQYFITKQIERTL